MRRVRINVTQRDIDRGAPNHLTACPVALAAHRHAVLTSVRVHRTYIDGGGEGTTSLPVAAMTFVDRFDRGLPVEPFAFTVEVPFAFTVEVPS